MAANVFRRLSKITGPTSSLISRSSLPKHYSIYEPDYLEACKPKYPIYPPLMVQLRAYDYHIIQGYQGWIHKIAQLMEFNVDDAFPMPARELKVTKYKPKSTVVESTYFLKRYERVLKISNVPSVRLPIFLKVLEAAMPEGVTLDVEEYDGERMARRYVPDKALLDLKKELMELQREKK